MPGPRRFLLLSVVGLGVCLACAQRKTAAPAAAAVTPDGPRLLVLVAVDQLPYEYLARFDAQLEGALRRLLDQGILFENARYGHAVTVTAAGHTTLASGLHPSRSGIVENYWYDRAAGEPVYSFGDEKDGRSPRNFLGTALPDWLKRRDPGARVFAASGKDRAAIAMAGHHPDGAYWYDDSNGGFESSTYYEPELPAWVEAWNDERRATRFFASPYQPLPPVVADASALGLRVLDEGVFTPSYPVALGGLALGPDSGFFGDVGNSPLLDELVLDFARALVETQRLGQGDHLDYLAIGLSSLDLAGHRFGPQSPQVADTLLRVDRELGEFLSYLDQTVGRDRVVVALSSDHGVAPIPEQRIAEGLPAQRPDATDAICFQQAGERVRERFGLDRWVLEAFYLDRAAITESGAEPAAVETAIARELETCDIVERAWTRSELEAPATDGDDPFLRLYRNSFHPERAGDLMVQLVEYAIPAGLVATHGSPYEYDRHVPVFVLLPGAAPARLGDEIGIVDLAPTLAGLVGLPTPPVDGRDLSDLLIEKVPGARRLPAYTAPVPPT
jgi:predicted AlkP superfamily pyrophosphatase or phosphodiesterase